MATKEEIMVELTKNIEQCQKNLDKFSQKFANEPTHALRWGDSVFDTAAELKINKMMLEVLQKEDNPPDIFSRLIALADRHITDKAKFPAFTSSVCENLMVQYELKAWANVRDLMKNINEQKETP